MKIVSCLLVACALVLFSGCGSTSDESEIGDLPDENVAEVLAKQFVADCGAVVDGRAENPISRDEADFVRGVRVADSNHLILELETGNQLVKLFGLGASITSEAETKGLLSQLSEAGAYVVLPSPSCQTASIAAGLPVTVQLFTAGGASFSERLLSADLGGAVESGEICHENLLSACYEALRESSNQALPANSNGSDTNNGSDSSESEEESTSTSDNASSSNTTGSSGRSAGLFKRFLWKPKAESAYNKGSLVIHVDACNATVIVDGERLKDYGPGNGRCNTSRAFKPGCAYGTNIKVQVIDNKSGRAYFHNGRPYVIVPNGCNRFEFD